MLLLSYWLTTMAVIIVPVSGYDDAKRWNDTWVIHHM